MVQRDPPAELHQPAGDGAAAGGAPPAAKPTSTKLYGVLGSHAVRTGMLLLEHKGIPYRTVMLPTGFQRATRLAGFPGGTVPAIVIDGRRVQTNLEIARALDEIQPDPPLFPRDEARRQEVEEAERWADEVFQMATRRLFFAGALHGIDALANRGVDGRLGMMLWKHDRTRLIGIRQLGCRAFNVNPHTERKLLAELPGHLDRIDAWIEAGVLNGDELNAADYALAAQLALLSYRVDLLPEIESRPLHALMDRVVPEPAAASAA